MPELVLILLVYYGVPTLIQDIAEGAGHEIILDINPFIAGVVTIGFIYGAFATEVLRGAFLAVPRGQIEAARAHGMGRALTFRRIVMPQMWRFALPGPRQCVAGADQGHGAHLVISSRSSCATPI